MTRSGRLYPDRRIYWRSLSLCSLHFGHTVIWERRAVLLLCRRRHCLVTFQLADEFFQSGFALSLSPSLSQEQRGGCLSKGTPVRCRPSTDLTSVASPAVLKRQLFLSEDRALSTSNRGHSLGRLGENYVLLFGPWRMNWTLFGRLCGEI